MIARLLFFFCGSFFLRVDLLNQDERIIIGVLQVSENRSAVPESCEENKEADYGEILKVVLLFQRGLGGLWLKLSWRKLADRSMGLCYFNFFFLVPESVV